MHESNSSSRKPWPMRWTILAIAGFIILYTAVTVFFRKEDAAHHPYEESQVRGGRELQEVGWQPFPNAYGVPGDSAELSRLPIGADELASLEEISFEVMDRQDERVEPWSDRLPPLEQGEQLRRLEAPATISAENAYLAKLFWDAPENFLSPLLVVFRQENRILIVPRAPERFGAGRFDQTVFIIPPESLEPGDYEVFLSTEGRVNQWTFRVE